MLNTLARSAMFVWWNARHRIGQMLPVTLAFLLLIGTIQMIGNVQDVTSALVMQQIARSWRAPFDLLVRPASAVSQAERTAGWVNPQSVLENYGGITPQQVEAIGALPHVEQVTPYANVGWQAVNIVLPVLLTQTGVYRVSAMWNGQPALDSGPVYYVAVRDLGQLSGEPPIPSPSVYHLFANKEGAAVVFSLPVQALQALIGVSASHVTPLRQVSLHGSALASSVHLSVRVERLHEDVTMLPSCVQRSDCWTEQPVHLGTVSVQPGSMQLYRYSVSHYVADHQQAQDGQVSIVPQGKDEQGLFYRTASTRSLSSIPSSTALELTQMLQSGRKTQKAKQISNVVPFSSPVRLPVLPAAIRFIPLEQACAINGLACYSGLYLRLSGVDHYSQNSLSLLQATAAAITARTGLHVDILDGSSFRAVTVHAPDGSYQPGKQPQWRVLGVAVQIVHGSDGLQLTLLILCSLVCLLAVGVAGVLIGVGRRKDVLLLQAVGWPRSLQWFVLFVDGLLLCLPGCLLALLWTILAGPLRPTDLWSASSWALLGLGMLLFISLLMKSASPSASGKPRAVRTKRVASFVCSIAVTAAAFFIMVEYLLVSSFDQVLVVTILGYQVREALAGPQIALFFLVLAAALLTAGLCTFLLVRERRNELILLAMVGWDKQFVLLRVLWDSWRPALLCGLIAATLALAVVFFTATLPAWVTVLVVFLCGPLIGILLATVITIGPAWQEMERAFLWR